MNENRQHSLLLESLTKEKPISLPLKLRENRVGIEFKTEINRVINSIS